MKEKIFLLLVLSVLLVDARSNRVERQSAIQMGMKMFEDFRGGVQRTFQDLMGNIMGRPRRVRGRAPFPPNAAHRLPPNSPHQIPPNAPHQLPPNAPHQLTPNVHRLPPNSPHHLKPQQQHLTIVHHDAPSPVFKASTSSSFSVIHDNHPPTESPKQNEIFGPDHFGGNSITLQKQGHDKRQANQPTSNFIQHRATDVENMHASFIGSQLIEDIPITVDGWVAVAPPKRNSKNDKSSEKSSSLLLNQDHKNVDTKQRKQIIKPNSSQTSVHIPSHSENTNNIIVPSEVKRLTPNLQKNYQPIYPDVNLSNAPKQLIQHFPEQKRPVRHDTYSNNVPSTIYQEDIRRPLRVKNSFNSHDNNYPNKKRINLARNKHRNNRIRSQQSRGKLISNGMKMELSHDKNKDMKVAGYEFGYGVVDDDSGNRFYHAEKKKGGMTQGSYKVQLPDGRIQTVEYTADHKGYRPNISFEGKAKYPNNYQQATIQKRKIKNSRI